MIIIYIIKCRKCALKVANIPKKYVIIHAKVKIIEYYKNKSCKIY